MYTTPYYSLRFMEPSHVEEVDLDFHISSSSSPDTDPFEEEPYSRVEVVLPPVSLFQPSYPLSRIPTTSRMSDSFAQNPSIQDWDAETSDPPPSVSDADALSLHKAVATQLTLARSNPNHDETMQEIVQVLSDINLQSVDPPQRFSRVDRSLVQCQAPSSNPFDTTAHPVSTTQSGTQHHAFRPQMVYVPPECFDVKAHVFYKSLPLQLGEINRYTANLRRTSPSATREFYKAFQNSLLRVYWEKSCQQADRTYEEGVHPPPLHFQSETLDSENLQHLQSCIIQTSPTLYVCPFCPESPELFSSYSGIPIYSYYRSPFHLYSHVYVYHMPFLTVYRCPCCPAAQPLKQSFVTHFQEHLNDTSTTCSRVPHHSFSQVKHSFLQSQTSGDFSRFLFPPTLNRLYIPPLHPTLPLAVSIDTSGKLVTLGPWRFHLAIFNDNPLNIQIPKPCQMFTWHMPIQSASFQITAALQAFVSQPKPVHRFPSRLLCPRERHPSVPSTFLTPFSSNTQSHTDPDQNKPYLQVPSSFSTHPKKQSSLQDVSDTPPAFVHSVTSNPTVPPVLSDQSRHLPQTLVPRSVSQTQIPSPAHIDAHSSDVKYDTDEEDVHNTDVKSDTEEDPAPARSQEPPVTPTPPEQQIVVDNTPLTQSPPEVVPELNSPDDVRKFVHHMKTTRSLPIPTRPEDDTRPPPSYLKPPKSTAIPYRMHTLIEFTNDSTNCLPRPHPKEPPADYVHMTIQDSNPRIVRARSQPPALKSDVLHTDPYTHRPFAYDRSQKAWNTITMPHSDYASTSVPDHPYLCAYLRHNYDKLQKREVPHQPVLPSTVQHATPIAHILDSKISSALQHIDSLRYHNTDPLYPMPPVDNYVFQLQALQHDLQQCQKIITDSSLLVTQETNDALVKYGEIQGIFTGLNAAPAGSFKFDPGTSVRISSLQHKTDVLHKELESVHQDKLNSDRRVRNQKETIDALTRTVDNLTDRLQQYQTASSSSLPSTPDALFQAMILSSRAHHGPSGRKSHQEFLCRLHDTFRDAGFTVALPPEQVSPPADEEDQD